MNIPLIKVSQKNEYIYSTKLKVNILKEFVSLNFRYPYIDTMNNDEYEMLKFNDYLQKLIKKGLNVDYSDDSVQRKLQISRINSISNYIEESNNFLPTSIILGCFNKNVNNNEIEIVYDNLIKPVSEELDIYSLDLNKDFEMIAIDGQHRLAGLFINDSAEVQNMEIPVILLFEPSLSLCSKIFIDINGNQKPVDKSLIYDLTSILEQEQEGHKLKDKEISTIQICHRICKTFYDTPKSPFYMQIRMLGTGKGCVSQSFIVEYLYPIIQDSILSSYNEQEQFNALYYYFKAIQTVFQNDWPVLANEVDPSIQNEHADNILKYKKSQLPKTLGIGALLLAFPDVFKICNFNFDLYKAVISKLVGKIIWSRNEYDSLSRNLKESGKCIYIETTNKSNVKRLSKEILKLIYS